MTPDFNYCVRLRENNQIYAKAILSFTCRLLLFTGKEKKGKLSQKYFLASKTEATASATSQLESSLKVGSHDPIFSSNYCSAHFLRQQLDV